MKQIFLGLCCFLAASVAVSAAPLALTENGKAKAEIVLDLEKPQRQIEYAATELSHWLENISGAKIPIVKKAGDTPVKIYLGTDTLSPAIKKIAEETKADFEKLGDTDGFIIKAKGNDIYIYAKKTKGVLNGVYRFLEKNTDIIFVRALHADDGFGTIYGKNPNVANTIESLVDVPVFTGRYWTGENPTYVWQARNLNTFSRPFAYMDPETYKFFSTVGDTSSMGAGLSLGIISPVKYYDKHPDFFPLVKGKRVNYHDCQLCFMNPEMIKAFCEEAGEIVANQPATVGTYDIGLGDNWDVCECPLCTAPIKLPNGKIVNPSDKNFRSTQYQLFLNAVSDYLTKRFPHVKPIGAAGYLFTAEAPAVPPRGKGFGYCPYIKNHKKPVFDDSVNANWHKKAEDFKAAGAPCVSLYEYYLCTSTPQFYHAISEVAQLDFRYYLPELKSIYLDVCCADREPGDAGIYDISTIEFYVISRLMWNPGIDVKEARREYCRRAYREAAKPMIEYYEKLAENYNSDPMGCYWNDNPISAARHYIVDKDLTGFVKDKLAEAEKLASHPGSKELIRRHRVRMESMVDEAAKLPKKETVDIPITDKAPQDFTLDADEWKKAGVISGFKVINDPHKDSPNKTVVKFMHDKKTLYIGMKMYDKTVYEPFKAEKFASRGENAIFGWGGQDGPYVEMFIDGDQRANGSYYHLAFALNGNKYNGKGSAEDSNKLDWTVRCQVEKDYWTALITIPLGSIGVNISQGNKLGGMILGNDGAWNGGQWHSVAGFQNLVLHMD